MNPSQFFRVVLFATVAFVVPIGWYAVRDLFNEPRASAVVIEYPPLPQPRPVDDWVAPEKGLLPATPVSKLLSR